MLEKLGDRGLVFNLRQTWDVAGIKFQQKEVSERVFEYTKTISELQYLLKKWVIKNFKNIMGSARATKLPTSNFLPMTSFSS